jgi:hypothetical protein
MNSKRGEGRWIWLSLIAIFALHAGASAYEIFIYRPQKDKKPLAREFQIFVTGEFFGQLQLPCTFPSYNDLSGPEDRWTLGFRNRAYLTESTAILAQLVTHDDGSRRTKFDWHFSLRQNLWENLVIIVGHDSDHDSDHQSFFRGKPYYTNRNYIGVGLPVDEGSFYIEPFVWLFHHTNQRTHLDLSGTALRQEIGARLGAWFADTLGLHVQVVAQSNTFLALGQTYLADILTRLKMTDWIELSVGASIWKDLGLSPGGNQQKFYKFVWGIAIPF